jgi:hypothetical protein
MAYTRGLCADSFRRPEVLNIAKIRTIWHCLVEFLGSDFRVAEGKEPLGVGFGCRQEVELYKHQIRRGVDKRSFKWPEVYRAEAPSDCQESACGCARRCFELNQAKRNGKSKNY